MTKIKKQPSLNFTIDGVAKLKTKLADLKKTRPKLVDRLAKARSFGDLSENSEYTNAKEELAILDGQIYELESVLRQAKVIEKPKNKAGLGSEVVLKNDHKQMSIKLVSHWESDPLKKKISVDSPLGQAVNGKKIGDTVVFSTPSGETTYKVIKIK